MASWHPDHRDAARARRVDATAVLIAAAQLAAEFHRTRTLAFVNALGPNPRSVFYLNGEALNDAAADLLNAVKAVA